MKSKLALRSVVTVGAGRGFLMKAGLSRVVITAAHCLPSFPPCMTFSHLNERTYRKLLAPLGGEPSVWAECLFVDPIADLAVLGPPDDQQLSKECEAYEALAEAGRCMAITRLKSVCPAFLLSLENTWLPCTVSRKGRSLWLANAEGGIRGGMSGSPIVTEEGRAMGIVCTGSKEHPSRGESEVAISTEGGPNPYLLDNLPGWLLKRGQRATL